MFEDEEKEKKSLLESPTDLLIFKKCVLVCVREVQVFYPIYLRYDSWRLEKERQKYEVHEKY